MLTKAAKSETKKIPKIRFPGFFDEWEEERLGEVTKLFSIRNKKLINAKVYSVTNSKGFMLQTDHFSKVVAGENLSGYKIIKKNDFAYNPARINVGSIAHFKNDVGIISSLYVSFKTTEAISDAFLNYFLRIAKTKHDINVYGEGGVRIYLWYPLFSKIKIKLPSLPEQQKIADFLELTDKWIENLREQKKSLESCKKGMMRKIFTREIRFNDHSEKEFPKWEEKTLGEIATFLKGNGISKDDINPNGVNKCIRYGELYTEYDEVIIKVKSKTNVLPEDSFLSKKNDILVPSSGETALDIASASCVNEDDILLGGDLNVIRLKQGNNGIFFAYYLSNFQKRNLAKLSQGHSVVHLYASHLKTLRISIPSFTEQQKIAAFLTSIDKLIKSKHQQIIQAEQWKKGLMQLLFV